MNVVYSRNKCRCGHQFDERINAFTNVKESEGRLEKLFAIPPASLSGSVSSCDPLRRVPTGKNSGSGRRSVACPQFAWHEERSNCPTRGEKPCLKAAREGRFGERTSYQSARWKRLSLLSARYPIRRLKTMTALPAITIAADATVAIKLWRWIGGRQFHAPPRRSASIANQRQLPPMATAR